MLNYLFKINSFLVILHTTCCLFKRYNSVVNFFSEGINNYCRSYHFLKKILTYSVILIHFNVVQIKAQVPNFVLEIINTDNQPVFKRISYKKQFANKELLNKELQKIYFSLISEGYLSSSVDSIKSDSLVHKAYLNIGSKFQWAKLSIAQKDIPLIGKIGYAEKYFKSRDFKVTELTEFMEKIVRYFENNGYPFIETKLESLQIIEDKIFAHLYIEKNIFVKLDSLVLEGPPVISTKFMLRYLNIKHGMAYNENAYKTISNKIEQLPFITEKSTPILRLTDKQNKLYLFLAKKNASQFDGIVGILPDDKGKTIFTGDVKIKLVNGLLKNGETIDINWRRLQTQTQDLKARIIYPYIVGLPIGVDYDIKLYRRDSTFIDINNSIGLNYYFKGLNHFKVFYKQRNANLISTSGLSTITVLPEYADVITKAYGIGIFYENLDYRFNPKKGIYISAQSSVGGRQIRKNPKVNELAYTNLTLKTNQYQTEGEIAGYINLVNNHVLKLASQFGSVFGNTIYKNELYRLGGLRSLRGFDEESIFSSTYIIPTIEYRFLFEKNSNLFLFAEGAWLENNSITGYSNDTPISIGAGLNFETKAGIFNLSYGLGRQLGNSFDIRTGKIHAGLTALF